jgi:hypothetical protein
MPKDLFVAEELKKRQNNIFIKEIEKGNHNGFLFFIKKCLAAGKKQFLLFFLTGD